MAQLNNLKKLGKLDDKSLLIVDDDNSFRERLARAMEKKGFSLVTSTIAKTKTALQMSIITFTLLVMGLKGMSLAWAKPMLDIVKEYQLIYTFTLFVTIFTVFTGFTYLYANRTIIQNFLGKE